MKNPAPSLLRRIHSRLTEAESREPDPWVRDDLEIARLIVAHTLHGDAVACSPHVLASYEVLGLHPEKVWPAIIKRREALGPLEVAGAAPAKKPPQSVKLWPENTNGARAVNSCAGEAFDLGDQTQSVPMVASPLAAAYPNPGDSGSAKERRYFTVADLQNFFENCPPEIVEYRCLRTIKGMFRALEKRLNRKLHGGTFEFCLSVEDYRDGAFYRSPTSVRVNLRRAEKLGYLEAVYGADENGHPRRDHFWHRARTGKDEGLYRRVATYRLNVSLLERFRDLQRHGHKADVTPIRRKEPQHVAEVPAKAEQPTIERRSDPPVPTARKLTPREGPKLVNEVRRLIKGVSGQVGRDRLWVQYQPDDPRCRAPMSQEKALIAACMNLAIPEESAREFLKLLPHQDLGGEESS